MGTIRREEEDPAQLFHVVVNHEEQYSVWPADREVPGGWRTVGEARGKQQCLDHIDEVWSDMRPLSLRRHLAEATANERAADGTRDPDGG